MSSRTQVRDLERYVLSLLRVFMKNNHVFDGLQQTLN